MNEKYIYIIYNEFNWRTWQVIELARTKCQNQYGGPETYSVSRINNQIILLDKPNFTKYIIEAKKASLIEKLPNKWFEIYLEKSISNGFNFDKYTIWTDESQKNSHYYIFDEVNLFSRG